MSNFPTSLDDDVTLPAVNNNITEIGDEAINALRDAVINIETEIGIGASGSTGSIASRFDVSFFPDGYIRPSVLTGLGLVVLPITDSQVSASAAIKESKLDLDHSTADLYNYILAANNAINITSAFAQSSGVKLEPHLAGSLYRHFLSHIDIAPSSSLFLKDNNGTNRDNTNLYTLLSDINTDFNLHENANGTLVGTVPPEKYGHVSSGIFLNTSNFSFVPQTATDLQQFAQFIDNSNIFILGTRIQTFYSNGIARSARSSSLANSLEGAPIVASTTVVTYLLDGYSTVPVDSIDNGDDMVEFLPDSADITNNSFDSKFAAVKIGDIVTVNYGSFTVPHLIKERKMMISGPDKRYLVRINGKNVLDGYFTATISKPLFNTNKYGVLALAQANTPTNNIPSLVVGNPRGAQVLGIGFDPDQINQLHYNLHLELFPTGNPLDSIISLAPIDISGNQGKTPGKYTLESVVEAANRNFRRAGFNYRFIAFSYGGEFGIMLADPYNGTSFSIVAGILNSSGTYNSSLSASIFSNNVVGVPGVSNFDALGFGPSGANVASPNFSVFLATTEIAQNPTKIFSPLTRNNYYVNGVERERFGLEPAQIIDANGDAYWDAVILSKTTVPGVRVEVTYRVIGDLSESGLAIGKTLVTQSANAVDSGRYFIKNIQFNNCPGPTASTDITVYDAIHSIGVTPSVSAGVGTAVSLYFNSDSVSFSAENSSDYAVAGIPFKRHFEVYINQDGYTFSHERGRINISGGTATINSVSLYGASELSPINLVKISSKLRGYAFTSVTKISLRINAYVQATGIFDGYLCQYDGVNATHVGPTITGKKGDVVRFYDETNVDYIDFIFNIDDSIVTINTPKVIDVQLFPTLSLDDEVMLLGTVQVNDATKTLSYLRDERQFGNVSEKQFSNSALDLIAAPTRLLDENGIIRGFEIVSTAVGISGATAGTITLNGGVAVVNGKIIQLNNEITNVSALVERLYPAFSTTLTTINWFLCVNSKAELELIANTDFDPLGGTASSYSAASLDHTRLFYVSNTNNVTTNNYAIRGTYLADLILNQKDVTPIAYISTTVTGTVVTSITATDMRRFVARGYHGLAEPFVYGVTGNFRSVDSMNVWLQQLINMKSASVTGVNKIGNTVLIKDTIDVSGKTLAYVSPVTFVGDGGKLLSTVSANLTNVCFKNLRVETTVNSSIIINGVQNNFTGCYFSHTTGAIASPIRVATGSTARFTDNIFTTVPAITAFVLCTEGTLKQIFIGNVYKTGSTLTAATNILPSTITTLNSGDGA